MTTYSSRAVRRSCGRAPSRRWRGPSSPPCSRGRFLGVFHSLAERLRLAGLHQQVRCSRTRPSSAARDTHDGCPAVLAMVGEFLRHSVEKVKNMGYPRRHGRYEPASVGRLVGPVRLTVERQGERAPFVAGPRPVPGPELLLVLRDILGVTRRFLDDREERLKLFRAVLCKHAVG